MSHAARTPRRHLHHMAPSHHGHGHAGSPLDLGGSFRLHASRELEEFKPALPLNSGWRATARVFWAAPLKRKLSMLASLFTLSFVYERIVYNVIQSGEAADAEKLRDRMLVEWTTMG